MVAPKGFDESPKEVTAEAWLGTAWQLIFMMRDALLRGDYEDDDLINVEKLIGQSKEFMARSFGKLSHEDKMIVKAKIMEAYDE